MTCRCDCASCNSGGHAECYYSRPDGSIECGLLELVARAIHLAHFHPDDAKNPRVEELYQDSKARTLKQAVVAVRAVEDHVREERRVAEETMEFPFKPRKPDRMHKAFGWENK